MKNDIEKRIRNKLDFLYGNDESIQQIHNIVEACGILPHETIEGGNKPILIAYGDHLHAPDEAPLQTLHRFAQKYLPGLIGAIHLLPFYPYTSDDGFSVVDFQAVNPSLGDWHDIGALRKDFPLMFDLVLNHVSVSSDWFQRFLRDEVPYNRYFVTAEPATDLSAVVRPRTHPLLTAFETAAGTRYVWTTFSADQVDLNYTNPEVLLEIIRILLAYVQRGAYFIRLDAVAFLWKIPGTSCIHLPQTHAVIQLLRDVLENAAPWVKLITETNVPHHENILYFGDGQNEAHLVYQFALPPLLLHTLYTGDATILSHWSGSLQTPSTGTAFFNFTASHDGVGVRPVTDILSPPEIDHLLKTIQQRQGHVSYRANSDGTHNPYELNCTYFDALAEPNEPLNQSVDRFMTSQAIMLALTGLPAIYLPSLFGAANWHDGVAETGRVRSINREKFVLSTLEDQFSEPETRYASVFQRYITLLKARASITEFHPSTKERILRLHPSIFALQRGSLVMLHNVSQQTVSVRLQDNVQRVDVLSNSVFQQTVTLQPYQTRWLKVRI